MKSGHNVAPWYGHIQGYLSLNLAKEAIFVLQWYIQGKETIREWRLIEVRQQETSWRLLNTKDNPSF